MEVDQSIKDQVKTQRLKQLQSYYYELVLNKVSYQANGKTDNVEEMDRLMTETDASYQAVLTAE